MKIIKQQAILKFVTPNALKEIEDAGRTCYKSEDKITNESAIEFVKMLKKRKHYAMLEFADARFKFITDRGVSHEMVRHRLASYAQESTRYCNYGKDKFGNEVTYILPIRFCKYIEVSDIYQCLLSDSNAELMKQDSNLYGRFHNWLNGIRESEYRYLNALNLGDSPQEARDLLDNSLKTEINMKADFTEWLHFMLLRTDSKAHPQMQDLAKMALEQLRQQVPVIFDDL
jgi:thymidylate synthase (FAD)